MTSTKLNAFTNKYTTHPSIISTLKVKKSLKNKKKTNKFNVNLAFALLFHTHVYTLEYFRLAVDWLLKNRWQILCNQPKKAMLLPTMLFVTHNAVTYKAICRENVIVDFRWRWLFNFYTHIHTIILHMKLVFKLKHTVSFTYIPLGITHAKQDQKSS